MATPAQNQAAITAAIQAAAVADLSLLQNFVANNGASFNTIMTALTALAGNMSSRARRQAVISVRSQLNGTLDNFQTLISTTTDAQTAVPEA